GNLFEQLKQDPLPVDTAVMGNEQFWDQMEERIYSALKKFADQATKDEDYWRRLFANDAARGFAFIDLCRQRHDVALMNPPFGDASERSEQYLRENYKEWNFNLFCAFVMRMQVLSQCLGAITDRAYMLKTSYEQYRKKHLLQTNALRIVVDLGWEVLDANVEV